MLAGPDSSPKKALVGIDVSHSVQQFLVQQGSLDGVAASEEGYEVVERDR